MEYTVQKPKYQLNVLIETEDEIEFDYLFNYYSKFSSKDKGDSGIDLVSSSDYIFTNNSFANSHNFKIKCSMSDIATGENVSYYLYPRSSISNTPLRLANSVGIIDSGYRGFIMAKLDNLGSIDYEVKKGSRLCQICAPDLSPLVLNLTSDLSKTTRGEGGFGSTG